MKKRGGRYSALVEHVFLERYEPGKKEVRFQRSALERTAKKLKMRLPKNLGDIIYSTRYRAGMPEAIKKTQPKGQEWIIEGTGQSSYVFRLQRSTPITPNLQLATTKIPDATPELVAAYALSDEQSLLAKVRYNRLIDIFLGVTAYSLQNHLRTTVRKVGQVEIDELYVALDKRGRQFVVPVQAKGGKDRLSVVQTRQDAACCAQKYPQLICRPVSAQFITRELIALFELQEADGEVRILEERHYNLVPAESISLDDLKAYNT